MRLNDLVREGDTRKAGTERFFIRGMEKDCHASKMRPIFARDVRTVTVAIQQIARVDVLATVPDVITGKEILVQAVGVGQIAPDDAKRAAEVHGVFANLENGVAHFLRKGLSELGRRESLVSVLFAEFPSEGSRVQTALRNAFREVGVTVLDPELIPRFRVGDNEVEAELEHRAGPKPLMVTGQSKSVDVTLTMILRLDRQHIGAAIAATAAEAASDEAVRLAWSWLNGQHSAQDFRTGSPYLEQALCQHINAVIGPKHGRIIGYLRVDSPLRISEGEVEIDPRRHRRHNQDYEIRGTNRKLPLSHEVGWTLPISDLDRSRYAGGRQYEGFVNAINAEIDEATKIYLQEKTFGDVLFEFYADLENTQAKLGAIILEKLNPIAARFGVNVEGGVTTTLGRIEEALLFEGGRIPIPEQLYRLEEANQKIALSAEVPVRLDRRINSEIKEKLKNLIDGEKDKEGMLIGKIMDAVSSAMRAILSKTDTKSFLNSSLCGRENRDLEEGLQSEIAKEINAKFGLTVENSAVQISNGLCGLITLTEALIGKSESVEVLCTPMLYDHNAEFARAPTRSVRMLVPFTIRDIGIERTAQGRELNMSSREAIQEEFFHRYVQTISAYPDVNAVLGRVRDVVRSVTTSFIDRVFVEVLRADVIDAIGVFSDLSHVLQKQVLRETGLKIEVLPDQISMLEGALVIVTRKMQMLADSRETLERELNKILDEEAMYGSDTINTDTKLRLGKRINEIIDEMKKEQASNRQSGTSQQMLSIAYQQTRNAFFVAHHIPLLGGPNSAEARTDASENEKT